MRSVIISDWLRIDLPYLLKLRIGCLYIVHMHQSVCLWSIIPSFRRPKKQLRNQLVNDKEFPLQSKNQLLPTHFSTQSYRSLGSLFRASFTLKLDKDKISIFYNIFQIFKSRKFVATIQGKKRKYLWLQWISYLLSLAWKSTVIITRPQLLHCTICVLTYKIIYKNHDCKNLAGFKNLKHVCHQDYRISLFWSHFRYFGY